MQGILILWMLTRRLAIAVAGDFSVKDEKQQKNRELLRFGDQDTQNIENESKCGTYYSQSSWRYQLCR